MYKMKIFGAGSIGNHLSNAARALGWSVDICDIDPAALRRTQNDIYPSRYGKWDEAIGLYTPDQLPIGGYDVIFIGTPPDSHMKLAATALTEGCKCLIIEKPLCTPALEYCNEVLETAKQKGIPIFIGYDHVVGKASEGVEAVIKSGKLGEIQTLDVEFREHWGGIFGAHPWLDGPWDTYLGFWKRGGGASGEHSHAINLWQHFAHCIGAGRVAEVSALLDYVKDERTEYDCLCALNLTTVNGLKGRVVQDVVTQPPRKWGRVQGSDGSVEWTCGFTPGCDAVHTRIGGELQEQLFSKTRPDDFIQELTHIRSVIETGAPSGLTLERGLDTMLVIAAAHKSAQSGRTVRIDYDKGYSEAALSLG